MAVMARETWTDERLDDLRADMKKGFEETKLEVRDLRADMDKGFEQAKLEIRDLRADMDTGFVEVKEEVKELRVAISALNSRFDSMQQTMVMGFISLFVGIAACVIAGLIGAIALT